LEARQLRDTYNYFGCEPGMPTYRYDIIDAVKDPEGPFLCLPKIFDVRSDITTKALAEKGWAVMVNEQDENFKIQDLERKIFTPSRNRLMCEAFLKEAQRDPSGTIGKSIVFAVNQTHATNLTNSFFLTSCSQDSLSPSHRVSQMHRRSRQACVHPVSWRNHSGLRRNAHGAIRRPRSGGGVRPHPRGDLPLDNRPFRETTASRTGRLEQGKRARGPRAELRAGAEIMNPSDPLLAAPIRIPQAVSRTFRVGAAMAVAVPLSGCASFSPDGGMSVAANIAGQELRKDTVAIRTPEDATSVQARVEHLLKRPLTADTAVQIALLNNRGLQAAYNELGIAEAMMVRANLPPNPSFSFSRISGSLESELEGTIAADILALATLPARAEIAADRVSVAVRM
jgi:hypothetical protein